MSGAARRSSSREELPLQLEVLGRALLDVVGARDRLGRPGRRPDPRGDGGRRLVEQPEAGELPRRAAAPAAPARAAADRDPGVRRPSRCARRRSPTRRRCFRRRRSRRWEASAQSRTLSREAPVVVVSFALPRALPPAWPSEQLYLSLSRSSVRIATAKGAVRRSPFGWAVFRPSLRVHPYLLDADNRTELATVTHRVDLPLQLRAVPRDGTRRGSPRGCIPGPRRGEPAARARSSSRCSFRCSPAGSSYGRSRSRSFAVCSALAPRLQRRP